MEYTVELADKIAEALRAMPPKDPSKRRLNKQGLVTRLAQEIIALQGRGYTIEEIVESLHGHGLNITTPTLKSYLQRTKSAKGTGPKAGRRAAGTAARSGSAKTADGRAATAEANAGSQSDASRRAANAAPPIKVPPEPTALRTGKAAFLVKDKDSY